MTMQTANDTATGAYKGCGLPVSRPSRTCSGSDTTSTITLTRVLESEPNDPKCFTNQSHSTAYIALASALNFDSKGNAKPANVAPTNQSLASTVKAYTIANGSVAAKGAISGYSSDIPLAGCRRHVLDGVSKQQHSRRRLLVYGCCALGGRPAHRAACLDPVVALPGRAGRVPTSYPHNAAVSYKFFHATFTMRDHHRRRRRFQSEHCQRVARNDCAHTK